MKIFCFILSFYVMVLSAVPCCAEDNCEDETKTELSEKQSKDDHPDCNTCSPFFTCATCTGFTLPHTPHNIKPFKVNLIKNRVAANFNKHFTNGYLSNIWQPPKWVNA